MRRQGSKPTGQGLQTEDFTEGNIQAKRAILRSFRRIVKKTKLKAAEQELGISHADYHKVQRLINLTKLNKKKKRVEESESYSLYPDSLEEAKSPGEINEKDEDLFIVCDQYSKGKLEAFFKNELLKKLYQNLYQKILEQGP